MATTATQTQSDVLSLDEIDSILSEVRTRGEYKPFVESFATSGDLAVDLMEKFRGSIDSVYNSVNKYAQAHQGDKLKVVRRKANKDAGTPERLLLINVTKVDAARAAQAAQNGSK